jgi:hypothetical protein
VGNVFHGTDGYVVLSGYDRGAAFDTDGKMVQEFKGAGDHFGNFIDAVRSRDYKSLAADIEEGHLSSALCHLGNISYRLGEQIPVHEAEKRISGNDDTETLERFVAHLASNGLDISATKLGFGPVLTLEGETFTGERAADANPRLTRDYRKPYVVPTSENV